MECLNCGKRIEEDEEFCGEKCCNLYWKSVERYGSESSKKEEDKFYSGLVKSLRRGA